MSSQFAPHVTVACVIQREGKFLLVEEFDEAGNRVLNQPAGHLEANESLADAAIRETLEETGWRIALTGIIGLQLYSPPGLGITFFRTSFSARVTERQGDATIDSDIIRSLWLTKEELEERRGQHRSPLVMDSIERYLSSISAPLSLLDHST